MRKIAAFMAVGAIAILDVVPVALGQDKILIGQAFERDLADLQPQALAKLYDAALAASTCRKLIVTHVVVPTPTDPQFATLVAKMRETELAKVLTGSGLKPEQIEFVRREGSAQRDGYAVAELSRVEDREPPKLHVDSVPKKGSKVKAGQEIKVTMVARDDANDWQKGIQSIQLLAESESNRSVGATPPFSAAEAARRGCGQPPPERRLEATYRVPSPAPPIVRLKALAEDFANHYSTLEAEFPTGDWYGQIKWSQFGSSGTIVGMGHHGTLDVTVSYDGRGNLIGSVTGSEIIAAPSAPCTMTFPTPATMSAKVVGQYTPGRNVMSLQFDEPQDTMGVFVCGASGRAAYYPVAKGAGLDGSLSNLTMSENGVDTEREIPQGTTTLRLSVKLWPAKQ